MCEGHLSQWMRGARGRGTGMRGCGPLYDIIIAAGFLHVEGVEC